MLMRSVRQTFSFFMSAIQLLLSYLLYGTAGCADRLHSSRVASFLETRTINIFVKTSSRTQVVALLESNRTTTIDNSIICRIERLFFFIKHFPGAGPVRLQPACPTRWLYSCTTNTHFTMFSMFRLSSRFRWIINRAFDSL